MLMNGKMKDVKESGYDWKVQSQYWFLSTKEEDKNIRMFGALVEIGTKVETHLLPHFCLKIGEDTPGL